MSSDNLVLISHCSADADPAKLLAETLELKGYKTQCKTEYTTETKDFISECLLFIPVVSKNAESNKLGSFRIAWKVAAKKIDNLEAAATFILPVIVDDTSHYKEIVPKPFRTLPWLRVNTEEVSTEFVEMAIQMLGAQAKDIEFPPIAGGQSLPPFAFAQSAPAPAPAPAPTPVPAPVASSEPIAKPTAKPIAKKSKFPRRWAVAAAGLVLVAGGVFWWSQLDKPATPAIAQSPATEPSVEESSVPETSPIVAEVPATVAPEIKPEVSADESDATALSDEQLWIDYETHRQARRYEQAAESLAHLNSRDSGLSPALSLELARTRFAYKLDPDTYLAKTRSIVETSTEIQSLPPSVFGLARQFAHQRQAIRAGEGDLHSLLKSGPLPPEVALTDSYLDQGNGTLAQHFARIAQRKLTPQFDAAEGSERLLQKLEIFVLMAHQDPEAISRLEQMSDRTEAEETMLIRALVYQGDYDRALRLIGSVLSRPGRFDVATVLYSPPLEKLHSHPEFKTTLAPFVSEDKIDAAIAWVAARTQP